MHGSLLEIILDNYFINKEIDQIMVSNLVIDKVQVIKTKEEGEGEEPPKLYKIQESKSKLHKDNQDRRKKGLDKR